MEDDTLNKSQNLKLEGGLKGVTTKNTKQNSTATNIGKIRTRQLFGLTQETKFDTFVTNVANLNANDTFQLLQRIFFGRNIFQKFMEITKK
jgi:hypothetical protein